MALEDRHAKLKTTAGELESRIARLEVAIQTAGAHATTTTEMVDEVAMLRKRLLEIEQILYGCG